MILGIRGTEESWVYQDIFAKGAVEEARNALVRRGRKKLGEPDEWVLSLARPSAISIASTSWSTPSLRRCAGMTCSLCSVPDPMAITDPMVITSRGTPSGRIRTTAYQGTSCL